MPSAENIYLYDYLSRQLLACDKFIPIYSKFDVSTIGKKKLSFCSGATHKNRMYLQKNERKNMWRSKRTKNIYFCKTGKFALLKLLIKI
jgi:hypothetical protein